MPASSPSPPAMSIRSCPSSPGGPLESEPLAPVGEYAMSCLGRERIFDYFARQHGLRCAIVRLNYAVEMRYGVLVDIARKVYADQPVALDMGAANVIWQGDANAQALALLDHCAAPPFVLNVTGPETVSVRRVAQTLGSLFGKEPRFSGEEAPTALLNNAAKARAALRLPSRLPAPDAPVDRRLGAERRRHAR